MAINVNTANTQAGQLAVYADQLVSAKNQLSSYKSSISTYWQGQEVSYYYPEGIVDPSSMFFFNRDAIDTVYFLGFQDKDELDFRQNVLDKLGELEIKDGSIVPKE